MDDPLDSPDRNEVTRLQNHIIDEIFFAFGLSRNGWLRRISGPIFMWPAHHFAWLIARYQGLVPKIGFGGTSRKMLPDFNAVVSSHGNDQVPEFGPLIVASNHVGGIDSLCVASCIPRKDLKIMVSDIGFLHAMSISDDYFIFVPLDTAGRMVALHRAIEHLQTGGSVLVFAHGEVEPDPELMPGAADSIFDWSTSLEIMLRKAPSAKIQLSIVSGIIHRSFMRNPFVLLRRTLFARQKLAEFIQIMQQMMFPRSIRTQAHVSLSIPYALQDFGEGQIMPRLIRSAQALLQEHIARFIHT